MSAALAAGVAASWWTSREQRMRRAPSRGVARWMMLIGVPIVCWPMPGTWLGDALPSHTLPQGQWSVRLLQGNIPQNEKFVPGQGVALALDWYARQVRDAVTGTAPPDLVVAPETAIPLLAQELEPGYLRDLVAVTAGGRTAVMLGIPMGDPVAGYTNSTWAWTPQRVQHRYDKHHLVPFGEFIPPLFRWFIDMMNIPLGDFARGALAQAPLDWAGQRIAPNICYEDLFGEELAASFLDPARAPTLLVNVSNIAWFGDTVAIDQHRNISRLRALELERPMVRATNTGATVAIDHRGRVTAELPRLTRGFLDVRGQGRGGVPPIPGWA
jgi:apolipoprotein N-acyltransferase